MGGNTMSALGGVGGVGGVGGPGGTGGTGMPGDILGDAALQAHALNAQRDGIVNAFFEQRFVIQEQEQQHVDDAAQLWRWEPWVRAAVFDFELVSNIAFAKLPNKDAVCLWHRSATVHGDKLEVDAPQAIVTLYRPGVDVFTAQLEFMDRYADLRGDRIGEIILQTGPQTAFWSAIIHLHPSRTPKTIELLETAVRFAIAVEMRFKHALACIRAIDYSPQVQPIIQTPGHGTLPSGHSTQAYIVSRVIWELLKDVRTPYESTEKHSELLKAQLDAQAARVAINRTVAGVHFPVDTACGHLLGTTLAEYFVHRCKLEDRGDFTPRTFLGNEFVGERDFDSHEPLDHEDKQAYPHIELGDRSTTKTGSEVLAWLWNQARSEWDGKSLRGTRIDQPGARA